MGVGRHAQVGALVVLPTGVGHAQEEQGAGGKQQDAVGRPVVLRGQGKR